MASLYSSPNQQHSPKRKKATRGAVADFSHDIPIEVEVEPVYADLLQQSSTVPADTTSDGGGEVTAATLAARDSLALEQENEGITLQSNYGEGTSSRGLGIFGDSKSGTSMRRRRTYTRLCVLLALLMVVILSVTLTARKNRRNRNNSAEPGQNQVVSGGGEEDARKTTAEYQLLADKVEDPDTLLDPSTYQGKAFADVLEDDTPTSDFRLVQRFALKSVFYGTGGETEWAHKYGWDATTPSVDECDWDGANICRASSRDESPDKAETVASIELLGIGVTGEIPQEVCLLEHLEEIILPNNEITGAIPECLTAMSTLRILDLHDNKLSGGLPNGLSRLENLVTLDLSQNELTGDLSNLVEVVDSTPTFNSLRDLKLDDNEFSGEIPGVSLIPFLESLTLENNVNLEGDLSGLCDLSLAVLSADCEKVTCPCCTTCH